jgi:hypothetical protein
MGGFRKDAALSFHARLTGDYIRVTHLTIRLVLRSIAFF